MKILSRLPQVRGQYREHFALADVTWFRVGGSAEVLFKPKDTEDLRQFLKNKPADVPHVAIGVGSNLLVRDGGVPGVVIRLGREFATFEVKDTTVIAGAGALDVNVAEVAAQNGIGGLEFLVGVPGTIGGALAMNAGAYGSEVKDVLLWAEAIDEKGELHKLKPEDFKFRYRGNGVSADWIFVRAAFKGFAKPKDEITARMKEIQTQREASQPVRTRTGGSTFANPADGKAWQLIDEAGCRGLELGGAKVSEMHCNFLINTGSATAADLENLGDTVRERVKAKSGVELKWEIRRIGKL